MMQDMRCHDCDHGFECCHEASVRHADGTTECFGDGPCHLAHELHAWRVDCEDLACTCNLEPVGEAEYALPLAA